MSDPRIHSEPSRPTYNHKHTPHTSPLGDAQGYKHTYAGCSDHSEPSNSTSITHKQHTSPIQPSLHAHLVYVRGTDPLGDEPELGWQETRQSHHHLGTGRGANGVGEVCDHSERPPTIPSNTREISIGLQWVKGHCDSSECPPSPSLMR